MTVPSAKEVATWFSAAHDLAGWPPAWHLFDHTEDSPALYDLPDLDYDPNDDPTYRVAS